jgi:hypothetical protein
MRVRGVPGKDSALVIVRETGWRRRNHEASWEQRLQEEAR